MRVDHHIALIAKPRTLVLRDLIFSSVLPGHRVLDAGTGSGLLATWAALAGAEQVVTVDREHSGLALEIAKVNGVADRVQHVTADLSGWEPEGRFDVVIGMLYENDPRRDDWLNEFVPDLLDKALTPDGVALPSGVRYRGRVVESPALAHSEATRRLQSSVDGLSRGLGVNLSPLLDWALRQPIMGLFPPRQWDGRLLIEGRSLGPDSTVLETNYLTGINRWPPYVDLPSTEPGVATCVVWTQELLGPEGELIFANESVSWLDCPMQVEPDSNMRLYLGSDWFERNVISRG